MKKLFLRVLLILQLGHISVRPMNSDLVRTIGYGSILSASLLVPFLEPHKGLLLVGTALPLSLAAMDLQRNDSVLRRLPNPVSRASFLGRLIGSGLSRLRSVKNTVISPAGAGGFAQRLLVNRRPGDQVRVHDESEYRLEMNRGVCQAILN